MLSFFAGAVAILAGLSALYWRWAKRIEAEIAEGADHEWARLGAGEPALLEGFDRARFGDVYRRVHFPRFPKYALAAVAAFIACLPVAFGVLAAGAELAERFGLAPNSVAIADRYFVEEGRMRFIRSAPPEAAAYWVQDMGGFYYFFGVVLLWIIVVAVVMRRYHARRPGYLRDELLRERN